MFLDLISSDNNLIINISLIQILGLNGAAYCSVLVNIYNKAEKKNKLIDDEYVKLNRAYITERTALSVEEQLIVDSALMKLNIIKKHVSDPDIIKLDYSLLYSLVTSNDNKLIEDIKRKIQTKTKKSTKESQRQKIIEELKNNISFTDYELITAMRDWIDTIYAKPNGYLSKAVIKNFEECLLQYTEVKDNSGKHDLDLALRLIKIATTQGYKECQWAINVYEKDSALAKKAYNNKQITNPDINLQKKVDKNNLSDDIF